MMKFRYFCVLSSLAITQIRQRFHLNIILTYTVSWIVLKNMTTITTKARCSIKRKKQIDSVQLMTRNQAHFVGVEVEFCGVRVTFPEVSMEICSNCI